jgi:signal transduction histidine kinase
MAPMRFPPPIRITAPLLALVFGLGATWLDYRLNLESDLARPLRVMRTRADLNGRHLARLSEELLATSQRDALEEDLKTRVDSSQLKIAGVVDQSGRIVADSTGKLRGQPVASTPLAAAAALINQTGQAVVSHDVGMGAVISAHPFRIGERDKGWVLLEFDITEVIAAARADARVQLGWMASAMSLLSLTLWAVLHFGFAARLGRLADSVQAFGEGRMDAASLPAGSDEVGELACAFSTMAAKLHEREIEQFRLEHEVLEISESERRRIGHDLHDGLGQRLTAASMGLNALVAALKAEDAPALAERGEDIGRQIREAIAETRSLSHGLAPVALVDDGLMSALVSLAESTSRGGTVRCVFECAEPIHVAEAEVADHLYRIAQEAVNNALKHAAPSEIRIGLERQNGALVLEVDDDGEGLNESAPLATGIGLRVMRYRARLIGGDLEIGSPPAGGTRVCCRVKLDT